MELCLRLRKVQCFGISLTSAHFGDWEGDRPLHGFAFRSIWTLDEAHHKENPYKLRLMLKDTAETRALWNHHFGLIYDIELLEDCQLKLTLQVENRGQQSMAFHQLFHPYFRVDVERLKISGLGGAQYIDKTNNFATEIEMRDNVVIDRFTDFVYMNTDHEQILDDGKRTIRAEKSSTLPDTVVWNPRETWALHGLAEGEQNVYVCVEGGHVSRHVDLSPGQRWTAQLLLTAKDLL